jgi:hypothetical protein
MNEQHTIQYPGIYLQGIMKTTKKSVRIVGFHAKIKTHDLSNIRHVC